MGELTEQLRMRPSREQRRPRDDHVILCSTFAFLLEFQNRIFLKFFARISSCSNIKPFEVWGSTVVRTFYGNRNEQRYVCVSVDCASPLNPIHKYYCKQIMSNLIECNSASPASRCGRIFERHFVVVLIWWATTNVAELLLCTHLLLTPGTPLNIIHSNVLPNFFRTNMLCPREQELRMGASERR
jgi:hypothetical protein